MDSETTQVILRPSGARTHIDTINGRARRGRVVAGKNGDSTWERLRPQMGSVVITIRLRTLRVNLPIILLSIQRVNPACPVNRLPSYAHEE